MAISITSASNKQTANFKSNETAEPMLKSFQKNKLTISSQGKRFDRNKDVELRQD